MKDEKSEPRTTTGTGVRIWTGKLRLNGERKKEGEEVNARIIVTGATVVFEVNDGGTWVVWEPSAIHAASWLRALGATGSEVG